MKKFLFLGIGSALMFTMGGVGPAQADTSGPIHKSTQNAAGATTSVNPAAGRCAGCHRAHTAKATYLLKEAQPALCYSCHGPTATGSSLDVVDGVDRLSSAGLRGGGFEYALIAGGNGMKTMGPIPTDGSRQTHSATEVVNVTTPVAVTSNHKIDGTTTGTMWGNGAISANVGDSGKGNVLLECGSCHDPHGNGNYRILKGIPNDANNELVPAVKAVAYKAAVIADPNAVPPVVGSPEVLAVAAVPAVMEIKAEVNIPDAASKDYTTVDYWSVADRSVPTVKGGAAPAAAVADGYIANIGAWCTTCHTRYLAKSPDWSTDSGDANFTYRHTSGRADKPTERPNCIQCHVSHGSNVVMSGSAASDVGFPGGAIDLKTGNAVVPSASSRLLRVNNRGTCQMCHNV